MKKTSSVIQKAVLIGVAGGTFELMMDLVRRPLSDREAVGLLGFGLVLFVVWVLDDFSRVLKTILEEVRKR